MPSMTHYSPIILGPLKYNLVGLIKVDHAILDSLLSNNFGPLIYSLVGLLYISLSIFVFCFGLLTIQQVNFIEALFFHIYYLNYE